MASLVATVSVGLVVAFVVMGLSLWRRKEKEQVSWTCPITLAPFVDPVVAADGYTYEREAIARWLETQATSPQTRAAMGKELLPNQLLRTQINEWRSRQGQPPLPPTQPEQTNREPRPEQQPPARQEQPQQRAVVRMSADEEVNQAIGMILAQCPELRGEQRLSQLEEVARSRPHMQHLATPLRRVLRQQQPVAEERLPERVATALRADDAASLLDEDAQLVCEGDTTLHYAVWAQAQRCVERLAALDQRPAQRDGAYPIHVAAARGNPVVVVRLLASGANPNARALGFARPSHSRRPWCVGGARPLHLATNGTIVEVLLRAGASVDARDEHGSTPLHRAASRGNADAARALIAAGADVNAADFFDAQTPLHRLAAHDRADELVEALVDAGANTSAHTKLLTDTPMHIAAIHGNHGVLRALVRAGANVDVRRRDGISPVFLAASKGKTIALELLIRSGADCVAASESETLAHVAVRRKDLRALELVLASNGAARLLDAPRRNDQSTPLHLASALNFREGALALVNAGATVDARAADSDTPIHFAVRNNALDVADVLFARGADPNAKRDKDFATPLHLAAARGLYAMATKLIGRGADRTAKTRDGATPLDRAAQFNDQRMINILSDTAASST